MLNNCAKKKLFYLKSPTVCPGSSYSNLYSNSLYKLSQLLTGHTVVIPKIIEKYYDIIYKIFLFDNQKTTRPQN